MLKRSVDIVLAAALLIALAVPMLVIALLVKCSSRGPVLYWSDRVGRGNRLFAMPKFRSMRTDTPVLATHLLTGADHWITPIGRLLRETSLDELPQLWSIFMGHMSFVGPRPALFNQHDLIEMRTAAGVHRLTPGLSGWAQINGRDELELAEKVRLEAEYLARRSTAWDLKILALTLLKVFRREGICQADSEADAYGNSPRRAA
jgi:O-antigen biosynthesis protein WbqP